MTDGCAAAEPLLSAWLDGELSLHPRARVGEHLAGCTRCRAELESLRVTRTLLRNAPVRRVPAPLATALAHSAPGVLVPVGLRRPSGLRRGAVRAGTALLALAGTLGVTAFVLGAEPDPEPPQVSVPVEVFVANHLVRTAGMPGSALAEVGR